MMERLQGGPSPAFPGDPEEGQPGPAHAWLLDSDDDQDMFQVILMPGREGPCTIPSARQATSEKAAWSSGRSPLPQTPEPQSDLPGTDRSIEAHLDASARPGVNAARRVAAQTQIRQTTSVNGNGVLVGRPSARHLDLDAWLPQHAGLRMMSARVEKRFMPATRSAVDRPSHR